MNESSNDVLIVGRDDLRRCEVHRVAVPETGDKEALVQIETFGLSSNNITYLALGDSLPYRQFFPVPEELPAEGWVCPPVWGVASVLESNSALLNGGEKVYGFFPAARFATLRPVEATTAGFRVERPGIPAQLAFYHHYGVLGRDPFYLPEQEAMMVVMRPLFLTGLLLEDYLRETGFAGAERVAVSSAASKTAFSFSSAFRRSGGAELVGLSSVAGRAAAEGFDVYDRVVVYEEIDSLAADRPLVYVDISGSVAIRQLMKSHFGDTLRLILSVGLTHWADGHYGSEHAADEVPAQVFFAPGWSTRRVKQKGRAFLAHLVTGWREQMASVDNHFRVTREAGADAVAASWRAFAEGRIEPNLALVHNL